MAVKERADLKRERVGMYVTTHDSRSAVVTRADVEALERHLSGRSGSKNALVQRLMRSYKTGRFVRV